MRVLLVPSQRLEGWKAMDRYADSLMRHLPAVLPTGWTVTRQPDMALPGWARFPARWFLYPRMVNWDAYDVVHVLDHSYAHVLYGKTARVRAVLTVHDLYALERASRRRGIRGAAVRWVDSWVLGGMRRADMCLCDSTATLEALARWDSSVGSRGRVEFLGVDDHFFPPDREAARAEGRRWLDLPADSFVILHVGSCVPRKNIGAILQALQNVRADDRSVLFLQAGGVFTDQQRQEQRSLRLGECVRQVPRVPEEMLPQVYAAADIVVLPSLFEGFGFSVLEAFAVGVPVASSRNWSLRDFPDHLVESAGTGSPEELTEAILRVKRSPELAAARAREARQWARQWTWERVARGAALAYGAPI
ncbi:MAG: glycosyltransferase [Thermoanaerobaculia bacterium]